MLDHQTALLSVSGIVFSATEISEDHKFNQGEAMDPSSKRRKCVLSVAAAFLQLTFLLSTSAFAFSVDVSEAPTNDLNLTVSAIHSARKSILLNIYELNAPDISSALLERIQAGIHVEILEEGEPVGGFSKASKSVLAQLAKEMTNRNSEDHFYVMTKSAGGQRRFHFDHAKYAVVDGDTLLIGSEN